MEILGTHFALTLGSWRLRLVLTMEEVDEAPNPAPLSAYKISDVGCAGRSK